MFDEVCAPDFGAAGEMLDDRLFEGFGVDRVEGRSDVTAGVGLDRGAEGFTRGGETCNGRSCDDK